MSNIAIIPARGGSKRIPRKNIIDFNGLPMISWTIEAALKSQIFDDVIVSTDDAEIAETAKNFGASVPFLRNSYADDYSTVSDVVIYTLKKLKEFNSEKFDNVFQLMPNCPLRGTDEINAAWQFFSQGTHDFQISSFKYGWMNPWWASSISNTGHPNPIFKNQSIKRSQDLQTLYCPTGAIWIAKIDKLIKYGSFYGPGHKFCPMNWKNAVDIDNHEDLEFANIIFTWINKNSN